MDKNIYVRVFKGILIIALLFCMVLNSAFAVENVSFPHNDMGWWSTLQYSFHHNQLSIIGQNRGCSVYPDSVRKSVFVSSDLYRLLVPLSFKQLSSSGLVDVYGVNSNGGWTFLQELNYGSSYQFISGKNYALEFYNCPNSVQMSTSPKDCKTTDGMTQGDIICKAGSYLAQVDFNTARGVCAVVYDKVAYCSDGCSYAYCDSPTKDTGTVVDTNYQNGSVSDVWSQKQANNKYAKVITQLQNKIVNLSKLNLNLKNQSISLSNDRISKGQIDSLEKQKQQVQAQSFSYDWVFVLIPLLIIVILWVIF